MDRHRQRRLVLGSLLAALFFIPADVDGQVVQLPVYRVFQMPLNVVVPDGGVASIGGVQRGSWHRANDGLPLLGRTASEFSARQSTSSVHVTATIIDHREWDAAILSSATPNARASQTKEQRIAEGLSRQIDAAPAPLASVDELSARADEAAAAAAAQTQAEALRWIQLGDECLQTGKAGAARIFYRMAWRQGNDETRRIAQQRLARRH